MALSQLEIMLLRIRVMIGDFNEDDNENRYTDNQLKKMLRVAIEQDSGLNSVGLGGTDNITDEDDNVYTSYLISGMNDTAEAMYCLAGQLLILEAEYYSYIAEGGGVSTTLGPASLDEKSVINSMKSNLQILRDNYKTALRDYQLGKKMMPIRIPIYDTGVED